MASVRVAAAQFFSGTDVTSNLALAAGYVRSAAEAGAALVVLPENSNRVRDYASREECFAHAEDLDGAFVTGLAAVCAETGIFCVVGVDLRGDAAPDVHIASVLIGPDGVVRHVHRKHVLWDYEYTLFVPGDEPLKVVDTEIGRLGLLLCADGIVPDVPRVLALSGAQILCNSLNSRGPDELRVHVPLRAIENRVYHVSANTVGGPADAWPWMGGSQVIAPSGAVLARAGESDEGLILADIDPADADDKTAPGLGDLRDLRRPDLYADLTAPIDSLPAAAMYGPAGDRPSAPLTVATLQVSWFHNQEWTITRALSQIKYAAARGAALGVLPELFCFRSGEAGADPATAARVSLQVLRRLRAAAAEHHIWIAAHLVEAGSGAGRFYSTAYLISGTGEIALTYRRAHLDERDRAWATAGDTMPVADTPIGRFGFLIGTEIWVPEAARLLALRGAEVILHPTGWDRPEAASLAATERTEENRVHLVSAARLDGAGPVGSQIVRADEFGPDQPIALMRYPSALWSRPGFEEQLLVALDLREAHSKMMGHHLDPLATRRPEIYGPLTDPKPGVPV